MCVFMCVCVCVWCRGEDAQGGVDGCTDGIRFLGWMIEKRSAIAERELRVGFGYGVCDPEIYAECVF